MEYNEQSPEQQQMSPEGAAMARSGVVDELLAKGMIA